LKEGFVKQIAPSDNRVKVNVQWYSVPDEIEVVEVLPKMAWE